MDFKIVVDVWYFWKNSFQPTWLKNSHRSMWKPYTLQCYNYKMCECDRNEKMNLNYIIKQNQLETYNLRSSHLKTFKCHLPLFNGLNLQKCWSLFHPGHNKRSWQSSLIYRELERRLCPMFCQDVRQYISFFASVARKPD